MTRDRKRSLADHTTKVEVAEHRSVLVALEWLCTQTRVDLAAGGSMAQLLQRTVFDLLATNRLVPGARPYAETFPPLEGNLALVVFHDAAWANPDEPDLEGGKSEGARPTFVSEAPTRLQVRSQVGYEIYVTTLEKVRHGAGDAGMIDWRSSTVRRECRSMFAAETMTGVGPDDRRPAHLPDQMLHRLRVAVRHDPRGRRRSTARWTSSGARLHASRRCCRRSRRCPRPPLGGRRCRLRAALPAACSRTPSRSGWMGRSYASPCAAASSSWSSSRRPAKPQRRGS